MTEADSIKFGETVADSADRAGALRPKRKRGYFRALKRGEIWAIAERNQRNLISSLYKTLTLERSISPSPLIVGLSKIIRDEK